MTAPRSAHVPTRPRTATPASHLFRSSTAGWFAAWKTRQTAEAEPMPAPTPAQDSSAEAVAKWLAGAIQSQK